VRFLLRCAGGMIAFLLTAVLTLPVLVIILVIAVTIWAGDVAKAVRRKWFEGM